MCKDYFCLDSAGRAPTNFFISRILIVFFIIFNNLALSMEEMGNSNNCLETFFFKNSAIEIINDIKNFFHFTDNYKQIYFDMLPVEIIDYIFSFLFHEEKESHCYLLSIFFKKKRPASALKKNNYIKELKTILNNKNFFNASLVNKKWHELIKDRINRALIDLYKKRQKKLESEFIRISKTKLTSRDDLNTYKFLLRIAINLKIEWKNYSTLIQAIEANNQIIANLLLEYLTKCSQSTQKKIITAKDPSNNTALNLAISKQQKYIIEKILQLISSMNYEQQFEIFSNQNDKGATALFETIWCQDQEIIGLIWNYLEKFDQADQINLINMKDVYCNTVIIVAATWGSKKIVKQILTFISKFTEEEQIKIINCQNSFGNTALILCSNLVSNVEKLHLLLKHLKHFSLDNQKLILFTVNKKGKSALDMAIHKKNTEAINLLFKSYRRF